jgi:dipeptidyl-peptidase-4
MLPEITKIVDQKYDLKMYLYGWYNLRNGWPPKIWRTYNHHPRYLVNQFGFRNKMAILSETFAHDRFYKRIQSAYAFASEIIEYTNQHGREMARINKAAEEETVRYVLENAGKVKKGVRFRMVPLDEKFTLRTYEYKPYVNDQGQTRFVRSGRIVEIPDVENHSRFEAEVESTLPRGYLCPAEFGEIAEMLARHGAEVAKLDKAVAASGEEFIVEKFDQSERQFEGHQLVGLSGTYSSATRQFPAGSFKIDLAQPLANLIFYLLEPESDDGLATWNFFDDYLIENGVETEKVVFPVFKYFEMEDR